MCLFTRRTVPFHIAALLSAQDSGQYNISRQLQQGVLVQRKLQNPRDRFKCNIIMRGVDFVADSSQLPLLGRQLLF